MPRTPSHFATSALLAATSTALVVAAFAAMPAPGEYASEGRNLPRFERAAAFSADSSLIHRSR
ncbi:hypothetical protein E0K89_001990 [Aquicoccus sp. SCR17]|nr:hypothetical protein [Carideicomes alvinocaridis]